LVDLLGKECSVVTSSECGDLKPGRVRIDDRQRAAANGAGRTQDRDPFHLTTPAAITNAGVTNLLNFPTELA